jgi:hypothetical protein
MRALLLCLLVPSCARPVHDGVANRAASREPLAITLDRAHPRRDCPPNFTSKVFVEQWPGSTLTIDACLRGKLVGDSVAVNVTMRGTDGRIASRRAIVALDGRLLLHGTETITKPDTSPPTVVALVDLDGDGKPEIIEEDEVVAHQHVTRVYKVYEDTIVHLDSFPHALEDGRQTCTAPWTVAPRALIVSARIEPAKRSTGNHDGLFECLPAGRHSLTVENDRLVGRPVR